MATILSRPQCVNNDCPLATIFQSRYLPLRFRFISRAGTTIQFLRFHRGYQNDNVTINRINLLKQCIYEIKTVSYFSKIEQTQIARFMGPTWGPPGPVGPRWAPCWPHGPCYQGFYFMITHCAAYYNRDRKLMCGLYCNWTLWVLTKLISLCYVLFRPLIANT